MNDGRVVTFAQACDTQTFCPVEGEMEGGGQKDFPPHLAHLARGS